MKFIFIKALLPIGLFVTISVLYFYPVLQGKAIFQSDIVQYVGMSKERNDFKAKTNIESYWTNSAFGGMPTYQLGAKYPHNYVKSVDDLLRFLPRPADYLFLYLISFYVLLSVMRVDYKISILGALAFGFSTYLIIILGVGHNAKAHAIAYFPLVLAGVVMVFQKRYLWGSMLTCAAMALEINANHFQMTYYLLILIALFGIVKFIEAFRERSLKHFYIRLGLIAASVVLALFMNATALLATKEYSEWSTRGKNELTINPDGSPRSTSSGLDKSYITEYSYGIFESFNLLVPRLLGGSSQEVLDEDSQTYTFLIDKNVPHNSAKQFVSTLPTYWGDQPIVAAPAYIGASVLLLFILAAFVLKGPYKAWLLCGAIVSLVLSWGKNISWVTDFMIDYVPLYNKFRAITSIQVVLELCVPLMAVLGLRDFFKLDKSQALKALKYTGLTALGIIGFLFVAKFSLSFSSESDAMYRTYYGSELMHQVWLDRKRLYNNDLLRTLLIMAFAISILWFYRRKQLSATMSTLALIVLVMIDLMGVDKRYVNNASFVSSSYLSRPFDMSIADKIILKDTSNYRVFDPNVGLNGGKTSYYHKSIGGYHAAKPQKIEHLYNYLIAKKTVGVLNMLNVKYIVRGDTAVIKNDGANGNAWFIKALKEVSSADSELKELETLSTKEQAIVRSSEIPKRLARTFGVDSSASVAMTLYQPNKLRYISKNAHSGFVVFSEMHYPKGWNAYIDGKKAPFYKVDYALRGLYVPKGTHTIVFSFDPPVVAYGSAISMVSSIAFGLFFLGSLFFDLKKSKPSS